MNELSQIHCSICLTITAAPHSLSIHWNHEEVISAAFVSFRVFWFLVPIKPNSWAKYLSNVKLIELTHLTIVVIWESIFYVDFIAVRYALPLFNDRQSITTSFKTILTDMKGVFCCLFYTTRIFSLFKSFRRTFSRNTCPGRQTHCTAENSSPHKCPYQKQIVLMSCLPKNQHLGWVRVTFLCDFSSLSWAYFLCKWAKILICWCLTLLE